MIEYRTAIGQDSHRFETVSPDICKGSSAKPLVLAGITIPGVEGLLGNSDADVIFHALTNAISGISCINILGSVSDEMCLKDKITDSQAYLDVAMGTLGDYELVHVSFSIECKRPKISPEIERMRENISKVTQLPLTSIGITATSGEDLTDFGKGLGIQVFCVVTVKRETV